MNQIFTHPGQPEMQAEVILASATAQAPTIYTIRARYPRIIHAEVMTHRVFSRNARSSRAVPVARMIQEVEERPFVPWHWGKNQKGMQASEECNELVFIPAEAIWSHAVKGAYDLDEDDVGGIGISREDAWREVRDHSLQVASFFAEAGYHKQLVNRLLEPFMWIDVLITSTDWENFLWLRDHKDAEPHLQDFARLVKQALETAEPQELEPGEWHFPYVTDEDWWATGGGEIPDSEGQIEALRKISAARCARISYAPFGSSAPDIEQDLALYDKLVGDERIHASPLEHQATPDRHGVSVMGITRPGWAMPHSHGNLRGWVQHRKLIPNEARMGAI